MPRVAPFGTWTSPISAESIVGGSIAFGEIVIDGPDILWGEFRPSEGGRVAILRRRADGEIVDAIPSQFSARSRVHEYGGGSFAASGGSLWFCNESDQQIWMVEPDAAPRRLSDESGVRHTDFAPDMRRRRVICVAEDHRGSGEAENLLVSVGFDGAWTRLHGGFDFYGHPRLAPNGNQLAWICWNHPNMPWDGTELWLAGIAPDGSLVGARRIAGSIDESIFAPEWSPDGALYFVSDRTGWWNLYRWDGMAVALHPDSAEYGLGYWQFGMSTYGFAGHGQIATARAEDGEWRLKLLDPATGMLRDCGLPFADVSGVKAADGHAVFIGTGDSEPPAVVLYDVREGSHQVLRRSASFDLDPAGISVPRSVSFPTGGGDSARGFLYMPNNKDFRAPDGELPPLIVKIHGGPTAQARRGLSLRIQYWTSRGFALLDVNYRGSTGYGTEYRRKLDGQWGVADVEDCVAGALWLADAGLVDRKRLIITGGSAGGYTVLAALTRHSVFRAGASHYGIGDIMALADDTHKFESRYPDRLMGRLPEAEAVWRDRSPINHVSGLDCPVIFFQGLDDKVVPPNQAEAMVAALRKKNIPVAYVPFAGEGHGFRRAENIKRALEGELYFYGRVFGFVPADKIEPLPIENL